MRLHKLKASEPSGTYLVESPVTEADILLMAPSAGESAFASRTSTDLTEGRIQPPASAAGRL